MEVTACQGEPEGALTSFSLPFKHCGFTG